MMQKSLLRGSGARPHAPNVAYLLELELLRLPLLLDPNPDHDLLSFVFRSTLTEIKARRVQRSAKVFVCGCEKFVPALAYPIFLALPGSCLARFAYFLADLCMSLRSATHPFSFSLIPGKLPAAMQTAGGLKRLSRILQSAAVLLHIARFSD